jgi:uncharacterized membrane protein
MLLRFSTRDLLWLVLVIGLVLGWMADNRQKARDNNTLREDIKAAQAKEQMAEARADFWEARLKQRIAGVLSDEEQDDLRKMYKRARDNLQRASDALSRK